MRHGGVDFSGKLNEASGEVIFLRLPREIKRIDWNTVPAKPGARIKRCVSERFRAGRVDDFPNVDAHAFAEQLEFVNEGDVHRTINVFEQLHHFRRPRRRNRNDAINDLAVKCLAELEAIRSRATDDFRYRASRKLSVSWILAFGREHQKV